MGQHDEGNGEKMITPFESKIFQECQRVNVKPGDILYVKIPPGTDAAKAQMTAECIHGFFKKDRVRVLFGDIDLEFTAVAEEK